MDAEPYLGVTKMRGSHYTRAAVRKGVLSPVREYTVGCLVEIEGELVGAVGMF